MKNHPDVQASSENAALREQIDTLVRPTARSLMPVGRVADGRIGKDIVTNPAELQQLVHAAMTSGAPKALPLLLSVNQEGGRLNALDWPGVAQLPGNMALGAAGDEGLAEQAGAAVGGQLRAVGLTWNLAPVCDTASWPSSSAVGTRSFGSDPAEVAVLASAFVRGLQAAGVAATAKHFPGLGGVTADPHHSAPVVDRLPPNALLPFRAVVEAGVASVMVGSHTVRELDERPALVSGPVIGMLRDDLGFDGVVVSENLSIPAIHVPLGGLARTAVAAVTAGVDVVMLDSEVSRGRQPQAERVAAVHRRVAVVDALTAAVESGEIDRDRINEAVRRVRRLHQRFGLAPADTLPSWSAANGSAERVASRIAARSLTVVRGLHLLPLTLSGGQGLAIVRVPDTGQRRADSARHTPDLLPQLLSKHQPPLPIEHGVGLPPHCGAVVVYGYDTGTRDGAPSAAAREAARHAGKGYPVVQVAFGDPDDLVGSPADVLVAAFAPHAADVAAVVGVLLWNECEPRGQVPVGGASW
jgi:beta-N-acetylhexosaminidase